MKDGEDNLKIWECENLKMMAGKVLKFTKFNVSENRTLAENIQFSISPERAKYISDGCSPSTGKSENFPKAL